MEYSPAAPRIPLGSQWEAGRFTLDSDDGSLVVIGVSSRLVKREDEIEAAKEDAARKVAMFMGTRGNVESIYRQGTSFFDYIADSLVIIESTADPSTFIAGLNFTPDRDVVVFDRGTIVRFRYGSGIPRIHYTETLDANGRPSWINRNNFDVDGYVAAVGFAQNQVWLRDTVMRATEAAAARLISGAATSLETSTLDISGQGTIAVIASRSSGELAGFRIIRMWIDPSTMAVYTLGIAKVK